MSANGSRSEAERSLDPLAGVRARGRIDLTVACHNGVTKRARVREEGAFRIRFPRERLNRLDAVLVNVAGGVVGGDRYAVDVEAASGTRTAISTVAAEKVYRSAGDRAHVDVALTLEGDARLTWMPQETILFDQARLTRRIDVAMTPQAHLTLCEASTLGRAAMGENVHHIDWREAWNIRRGGKLVFAERLRLEGDATAQLARKAMGQGARAIATLLHVAPEAEALCEPMREMLQARQDSTCEAAVSSFDGLLVVRLLAAHGHDLRERLLDCLAVLPDADVPRSWRT